MEFTQEQLKVIIERFDEQVTKPHNISKCENKSEKLKRGKQILAFLNKFKESLVKYDELYKPNYRLINGLLYIPIKEWSVFFACDDLSRYVLLNKIKKYKIGEERKGGRKCYCVNGDGILNFLKFLQKENPADGMKIKNGATWVTRMRASKIFGYDDSWGHHIAKRYRFTVDNDGMVDLANYYHYLMGSDAKLP